MNIDTEGMMGDIFELCMYVLIALTSPIWFLPFGAFKLWRKE